MMIRFFLILILAVLSWQSVMAGVCDRFLTTAQQVFESTISRPASELGQTLKTFSYQTRLEIMERLSTYRTSRESNIRMAQLIDDGIQKGYLKSSDAEALIARMNRDEIWTFFKGPQGELMVTPARLVDREALIAPLLERSRLSPGERADYKTLFFDDVFLSYRELRALLVSFKVLPNDSESIARLRNLIKYADSLPSDEKLKALEEAYTVFETDPGPETASMANFKKLENQFERYEQRARRTMSDADARQARSTYERLTLGCKARAQTPERRWAQRGFGGAAMGVSLVSTVGSYVVAHWDDGQGAKDWALNIGYDVLSSYISRYIATKVQLDPGNGAMGKMWTSTWSNGVLDVGNAVGYSVLFDQSDRLFEEQLTAMQKSPELRQELDELQVFLDRDPGVQSLITQIRNSKTEDELSAIFTRSVNTNPDFRDAFIEALSRKAYDSVSGKTIQTGDKGMDRYLFHRLWALYSVPRGYLLGVLTYNVLCMGQASPVVAAIKAIMIMSADQVANSYIYYYTRRKAIGQ